MNQLFIISDAAWAATTPQEVYSICMDLQELGLYQLPYPEIDLGVSIDAAIVWVGKDGKPENRVLEEHKIVEGKSFPPLGPEYMLVYRGVTLDSYRDAVICGPFPNSIHVAQAPHTVLLLRDLLISLLATRNVKKTTSTNKLARLGIATHSRRKPFIKRYTYTTTISVPSDLPDDTEHKPTGIKKCPHLRRGHIRHHQHFGPNRQFTRSVWIPPVFVNASEEFTRTREAYNLSLPSQSLEAQPAVESLAPTELEPSDPAP
jgi:hypothetical protein